VINDILDFSKIEAGKLRIENVPISVAEVVEGVCESLYPMALKKGVELTLFTDPVIPETVMGDAGRLRQILLNLANNAIKFSSKQERRGKVSLRAVLVESTPDEHGRFPLPPSPGSGQAKPPLVIPPPQPSPGGRGSEREEQFSISESLRDAKQILLEFRITDNGIGMDEATQARLFSPFTQADTSITRTYGGTGLGLVISRQLTDIMGGKINLQSEPGKGSIFSVCVPFELPLEQPLNESLSTVAGLPCLVVGGEKSLADDLAAYLVQGGAEVEKSPDVIAAQQWIERRPSGLCVVVIDTEGIDPTLDASQLDGLRAAARTRPNADIRFVTIERGGRQHWRVISTDLVELDAGVMHRRAFLEAVAIVAGRVKPADPESKRGNLHVKPLLSREEARRRGSLILIAEDNEINQKVVLQQLMLLGQVADVANNGREALKRWRNGGYAILFADLHMPEMDGYELAASIRTAEKSVGGKTHTTIIAFTASASKGEAERCFAIGMDDYLSKPVQLADLKAMLEKWMPLVSSDPVAGEATLSGTASDEGVGRALPADEKTSRAEPDLQHPATIGKIPMNVDVNVLKKLVGDDEAMIREFLHDFRLSAAKIAAELRAACAAGETAAAGAHAHKLKSSSRSVGALALGELCAEMEKAGKAGDAKALTALLPRFEQELAGVEGFLEGY